MNILFCPQQLYIERELERLQETFRCQIISMLQGHLNTHDCHAIRAEDIAIRIYFSCQRCDSFCPIDHREAIPDSTLQLIKALPAGVSQTTAEEQCGECENKCYATKGAVLGYVTPWNGRGYDVAKADRGRLTHVSPVWYQLNTASGSLVLSGSQDKGWIADVRREHDLVLMLYMLCYQMGLMIGISWVHLLMC